MTCREVARRQEGSEGSGPAEGARDFRAHARCRAEGIVPRRESQCKRTFLTCSRTAGTGREGGAGLNLNR